MRRENMPAGRRPRVVAVAAMLCLSGCAAFEDNVSQGYATGKTIGDTDIVMTTADVRTVLARKSKKNPHDQKIICSEPSPDTAMALALATKLSASTGAVTAGVEHSLSQTIEELAGRSVAVQALRDGTYRACEAYANGIIGKREYALILSQYGDVLSTLILAENAGSAKSGIDTVSNNYVNYALPRLAHAMFVTCAAGADSTAGANTFLTTFCTNIDDPTKFGAALTVLQQAMPKAADKAADKADDNTAAGSRDVSWTVPFRQGVIPTDEGEKAIATAVSTLKKSTATVKIVGHTDQTPPLQGTQTELSLNRAKYVSDELVRRDIAQSRIMIAGSDSDDASGRMARISVITTAGK